MCKIGHIYKYEFPNGKVYIGQTWDSEARHRGHKSATKSKSKKQSYLYNHFRRYGYENCELSNLALVYGYDRKRLDDLEIKYIKEYRAGEKAFGLNIEMGGNGELTELGRERLRQLGIERAIKNYKSLAASIGITNPVMDGSVKICKDCKEELPRSCFVKGKEIFGLRSDCNDCRTSKNRATYAKNKHTWTRFVDKVYCTPAERSAIMSRIAQERWDDPVKREAWHSSMIRGGKGNFIKTSEVR